MTFTVDLDLGVLKMCLHTKNEVCRSRISKVRASTGQTDATEHITNPHSLLKINVDWFANCA